MLNEDQVVDFFEQTMRLLRKQSHGFNLQSKQIANGLELEQVKEMLRSGDYLEKQKHYADWTPHSLPTKEPLTEEDVKKVSDYWYRSASFLDNEQLLKSQEAAAHQPLSIRHLLADEAKLIREYEDKIKAKEERRRAE